MAKPIPLPALSVLNALFVYEPTTGIVRYRRNGKLAGCRKPRGWRYLSISGRECLAHRVIWKMVTGKEPPPELDHEDTDRDNNRWGNIRPATRSQNLANMNPRTVLKGAYFHAQSGRWMSAIKQNGVRHYLGLFATPEEAHAAYCKAATERFGPFARY